MAATYILQVENTRIWIAFTAAKELVDKFEQKFKTWYFNTMCCEEFCLFIQLKNSFSCSLWL